MKQLSILFCFLAVSFYSIAQPKYSELILGEWQLDSIGNKVDYRLDDSLINYTDVTELNSTLNFDKNLMKHKIHIPKKERFYAKNDSSLKYYEITKEVDTSSSLNRTRYYLHTKDNKRTKKKEIKRVTIIHIDANELIIEESVLEKGTLQSINYEINTYYYSRKQKNKTLQKLYGSWGIFEKNFKWNKDTIILERDLECENNCELHKIHFKRNSWMGDYKFSLSFHIHTSVDGVFGSRGYGNFLFDSKTNQLFLEGKNNQYIIYQIKFISDNKLQLIKVKEKE